MITNQEYNPMILNVLKRISKDISFGFQALKEDTVYEPSFASPINNILVSFLPESLQDRFTETKEGRTLANILLLAESILTICFIQWIIIYAVFPYTFPRYSEISVKSYLEVFPFIRDTHKIFYFLLSVFVVAGINIQSLFIVNKLMRRSQLEIPFQVAGVVSLLAGYYFAHLAVSTFSSRLEFAKINSPTGLAVLYSIIYAYVIFECIRCVRMQNSTKPSSYKSFISAVVYFLAFALTVLLLIYLGYGIAYLLPFYSGSRVQTGPV